MKKLIFRSGRHLLRAGPCGRGPETVRSSAPGAAGSAVIRWSFMDARVWTRRGFLSSAVAFPAFGAPAKRRVFPAEYKRYADPSTELSVVRLTSPDHSSFLPAPYQRAVTRRRSFLLYSSDRTGSPQLFQMSLKTGESEQLTSVNALDVSSPTLAADDRSVFFFDGPSLRELSLGTLRDREVYRVPQGWMRAPGLDISRNNGSAVLTQARSGAWRLLMLRLLLKGAEPATVCESPVSISEPLLRPGHEDILYRESAGSLAMVSYDGRNRRTLSLAPGRAGSAFWTAEGGSVVYLNFPEAAGEPNGIREFLPDTGAERLIARTSQFAAFAPNRNASVFAGASASKASPYIVVLLRVTRRELALCEHRASDPASAAPRFSPDSQEIYFQSDRHGKPAIYSINLERLVEKTEP